MRELADITDYLEYKMGTIKTYNGRNNFLNTYLISIPYYVFLGCSRRRDVSTNTKAFHEEAGSSVGINQGGLLTPVSPFLKISPPSTPAELPEFFTLGPSMLESKGLEQTIENMGAPLSPFHYQLRKVSVASSRFFPLYFFCPFPFFPSLSCFSFYFQW